MPLLPGKDEFSHNVKEMVKAGHPLKVALAASYKAIRKKRKEKRET